MRQMRRERRGGKETIGRGDGGKGVKEERGRDRGRRTKKDRGLENELSDEKAEKRKT